MRIDWPGGIGVGLGCSLGLSCLLAMVGCAHHRADQYTYAPPYAPAVYPQPQSPALPTAYAAAAPGIPAGAVPAAAIPPGTVMAAPSTTAAAVMPAVGNDCAPCAPTAEGVVMPATLIEGGGQTPPCPPGP